MTRHGPHHPRGPPGRPEGGPRRLSDAADSVTLRKKSLARDRHGEFNSDASTDLESYRCKFNDCSAQHFSSAACLLVHERVAHGMQKKDSDSDDELIGGYMDDLPARSMNSDRRPMHGGSHSGKEVRSPLAHDRHGKMDSDSDDEPVRGQQGSHSARSMNPDRRLMHGGSHGGKSTRSPLVHDHHRKTDSDFDDERVGGQQHDYPARGMNPSKRSMHGSRYDGNPQGIPYGAPGWNPYLSRGGPGEENFLADLETLSGLRREMREKLRAVTDTGDGEAIAICKGRLSVIEFDSDELMRGNLKDGIKSREDYIYPDDGYHLEYPPSRSRHGRQSHGRHPRR